MKVCIGITTKNRGEILQKAINSALEQSYANKKVLVFDDGSTDMTTDLPAKYPEVEWMRVDNSIGLLAARNKMMKECGADLYVSLDDDAWFLKGDEIAVAVKQMTDNPMTAAISFDVLQNDTKRFYEVERTPEIETNVFIGCGHMLRLSAVEEVGYYVPFPLRYGHEEKDLCIRLIDKGYSIFFMPGVHVWHDYTSVERNFREQRYSFIVNDLIFPFRRVPLQYFFPVMLNNILRKLRSKQEDRKLTRRAVGHFFRLIPSQWKFIKRVKPKSYRKYRALSVSYLAYLDEHDQSAGV
jgi:glycosyltransferase involved in cell wall biosynthesis